MQTQPKMIKMKRKYGLLFTFLISLVTAAALFIPFIVFHGGIFYYYGDFNVQEIPFYQLIHSEVHNGNLGWNHLTDLGTDTIASYSFYLLGSPFFWLTIPFPNDFVPYLIGPILILKFSCAASAAYLFLRRYVQNYGFAVLGGLLYAFSGFSIYNVFFFHFHEPMIMFPLLLAALDALLYDNRRGVFAVAVFAACVVNYYFFVGQVLFVVMYFLMLTFTKAYRFKIKNFLLLAIEVIIGFCATAFMLIPSVIGLMGNPRLDTLPNGWNSLVFDRPQRYWLVILSFLFPADLPAMPVFTPESNCKWASVAGWLPLFGMTGVIAFLQLKKRDWLKKLITLLMLFAMVPVLNSMFQLMNNSIYYARWFYMLVLMFSLATIRAVEDKDADWNRAIAWSAGLTAGAAVLIGVMPKITEYDNVDGTVSVGVQATYERFWIYVLTAILSLLAFVLIYKKFFVSKRRFLVASTATMLGVFYLSSFMIIGTGTLESGTTDTIKSDIMNAREDITIDDLEEVRSDFYECVDNTAMFWKIPGMNCFQSSVSTSIMQFYKKMGITRDVASRPDFSDYGLRALFSCKYYFDHTGDNDCDDDRRFTEEDGEVKMPDWKFVKNCNNFDIYENENYIPMGFAYEEYVTEEEFERVQENDRTQEILCYMVLSRDVMKKYADITGYTEEEYAELYGGTPGKFDSRVDGYRDTYGFDKYRKCCQKLAGDSCKSFAYTKDGFEAEYENSGNEKLLFFSVPYSSGFTAKVNGQDVDVEKVNYGFMAVKVPAKQDCKIEFFYKTPGLDMGMKISLISLGAFAVYIGLVILVRHQKKKKRKLMEAAG